MTDRDGEVPGRLAGAVSGTVQAPLAEAAAVKGMVPVKPPGEIEVRLTAECRARLAEICQKPRS